ncbi:MAG: hypothetical protein MZV65_40700 [Chromatiales bacterium]|nr:hypothetical protein [Chromatiales bacterium]
MTPRLTLFLVRMDADEPAAGTSSTGDTPCKSLRRQRAGHGCSASAAAPRRPPRCSPLRAWPLPPTDRDGYTCAVTPPLALAIGGSAFAARRASAGRARRDRHLAARLAARAERQASAGPVTDQDSPLLRRQPPAGLGSDGGRTPRITVALAMRRGSRACGRRLPRRVRVLVSQAQFLALSTMPVQPGERPARSHPTCDAEVLKSCRCLVLTLAIRN